MNRINDSLKFRNLITTEGKIVCMAGAHNGLTAKLVEKSGFDAVWASGLEISASYGVPDANILSMSDFLHISGMMVRAVNIPIIADCDSGFGDLNNVMHLVRNYEQIGVAGICIEDKLFPKRNSFSEASQQQLSVEEFSAKIMAGKSAQKNPDFLLIARIETFINDGTLDDALIRAKAYEAAGADMILIHSKKEDIEEVVNFLQHYNSLPVAVVPTTYPQITTDELINMGVKCVIYANQGIRAAIRATEETLYAIKHSGSTLSVEDKIANINQVFEIQGMYAIKENSEKFEKLAKKLLPS